MSDEPTAAQRDWVRDVLGVSAAPNDTAPNNTAPNDQPPSGIVAYRKALLDLEATRGRVTSQARDLADRIARERPEWAETVDRVAEMIEEFCDEIGDTIDRGISETQNRVGRNEEVRRDVLGLINKVSADKLIAHVDRNPVQPLQIAAALSAALQHVADTVV